MIHNPNYFSTFHDIIVNYLFFHESAYLLNISPYLRFVNKITTMNDKYNDLSDEKLLDIFKHKYTYHLNQAHKFKVLIDTYSSEVGVLPIDKSEPKIYKPTLTSYKKSDRVTFESIVLSILKDGMPRTAKMLFIEYNKLATKEISVKDFSSKLSIRASNKGSIKNFKIIDYPIDQRFWWGLSKWFTGDQLKQEYLSKITDYVSSNNEKTDS